jgi:PPE-repeat protein
LGTSSSRSAPTTGSWPSAKRGISQFTGGSSTASSAVSGYVRAVRQSGDAGGGGGGSGGAAGGARGGLGSFGRAVATAQQLGDLVTRTASEGFGQALIDLGLAELVGHPPIEVLSGIIDALSGPGSLLDEAVARSALAEVLEAFYEEAGDTYEELSAHMDTITDASKCAEILKRYLIEVLYQKMLSDVAERISEHADGTRVTARKETELKEYIEALVFFELEGRDPLQIDWKGQEGQTIIERNLGAALDQLEIEDTGYE